MCQHLLHFGRALMVVLLLLTSVIKGSCQAGLGFNKIDFGSFHTHPIINQTVQDHHGFIWVASTHGLYRFDGVEARQYTTLNTPGLPGNYIYSLIAGPEGKLWIATNEGLVLMDTHEETLENLPLYDKSTGSESIATRLFLAMDSSIWLGMENNRFGQISGGQMSEIQRLDIGDYPLGDCFSVVNFVEDKEGKIFIEATCAYRFCVFLVDRSQLPYRTKLIHWGEVGVGKILGVGGHVFLLDEGKLYPYRDSLDEFDRTSGRTLHQISKFGITAVRGDGDHVFYAGSKNGRLWRGIIARDTIVEEYLGQFAEARILDIAKDKSDCLWLGTGDGVTYFSDRQSRFTSLMARRVPGQLYGQRMRGMMEQDDGYIYACAFNGLYRINPVTLSHVLIQPGRPLIALPYAICQGGKDFAWIGTDGYGLAKFDFTKGVIYDKFGPYADKERQFGRWVGELIKDSEGAVIAGTNNGILRISEDGSIELLKDHRGKKILENTFAHDIKEISKGKFWVGTNRGLYRLTWDEHLPGTNCHLEVHHKVPFRVREICPTSNSDIWMATEDAGLVHYDPHEKTVRNYTEVNGLPSHVLYSLLPGPNGELWIGTYDGLSRFDIASGLFSNFFVSDGLSHNEFNSHSQLIGSDGYFYMGTQDGIVRFHPNDFAADSSSLPLMISRLKVHNTKVDTVFEESRYAQLTREVRLGPHDDLVTIHYAIADYNRPVGNRFQYMLEGISAKWHYLGNKTQFVLPHLDPGSYTLRIRGAGSDGRWSTRQIAIPLTVTTAWYRTWWFSITVICVLAGIMWLIHRYRLGQMLKLERMRLRIAEDLHDELGSSLTGIGIQTELLSASEAEPGKRTKLNEISGHIQSAVSKLGDIVWSLQPETGSLGDLMDRIEEQAHLMLKQRGIDCHLTLPRESRELLLADVVKQNCFLIFKESITNIVKHSTADQVEIIMRCQGRGLSLTIADNGESRSSPTSHGGGQGLKNMRRRADKMSGEIVISNHDGFRIDLLLPKAILV